MFPFIKKKKRDTWLETQKCYAIYKAAVNFQENILILIKFIPIQVFKMELAYRIRNHSRT